MNVVLQEVRESMQLGELKHSIQRLQDFLGTDSLDVTVQAEAFELLGRCQHGMLANVQAQEAFAEAAHMHGLAGNPEAATYCHLMRVRQLLDERLLPIAHKQLASSREIAAKNGWNDVRALVAEFEGIACQHAKEHQAAVRLLSQAIAQPDTRKLNWERLGLRMTRASCFLALGDVALGREELNQLAIHPLASRVPRLGLFVLMNRGYSDMLVADLASARDRFQTVTDTCQAGQVQTAAIQWLGVMAQYNLGLVDIQLENYDVAHVSMLSVWQMTREHGYSQLACASLNSLSVTSLMLNSVSEAVKYAQLAHQLAQQYDDIDAHLAPYYLALAYVADGRIRDARSMWEQKPDLESNAETRLQFNWLARLVYKLEQADSSANPETQQLLHELSADLNRILPGAAVSPAQP